MATPAQAAAATVGAGSLAAAGAYGITQAVNGGEAETTTEESQTNNTVPTPSTFTTEDLTGGTYNNKFLSLTKEENLKFLVKPDNNEEWWKWAYENKYKTKKVDDQRHTLFTNVNDSETLKTACQQAYTQDKAAYKFEANDYLLENISTFCTKGAEKQDVSEPKVVFYSGSISGYDHGLLSVEANKSKLVKSKVEDNNNIDLWWNWAYKNLVSGKNSESDDLFKHLDKGYHLTDESSGHKKSLNWACDAGYKKLYFELTANSNALLIQIKKYCSKDTTEDLLALPDAATPTFVGTKADGTTTYKIDNSLVKKDQNKNKLVDPDANQNWWVWNFDKLFPKKDTEAYGKLSEPFDKVENAYSSETGDQATITSLNKACKKVYDKIHSDFSDSPKDGKEKLIDLVKKFCSTATQSSSIAVPTQT